jgi:hypothetical protein
VLAGCGGSSPKNHEPGPPKLRERLPPFRTVPTRVRVVPRRGNALTVFRIRIRSRAFVGTRAHAIVDYEAHVLDKTNPYGAGCIIDTGPSFPRSYRRPLEIVLDPKEQMGGRWCRGRFRGTLTYYRDFLCPAKGICRPPKNFPRRSRRVARLAFEVR